MTKKLTYFLIGLIVFTVAAVSALLSLRVAVVAVDPPLGSEEVARDLVGKVIFSGEPLRISGITISSRPPAAWTWSWSGNVLEFSSAAQLAPEIGYQLKVSGFWVEDFVWMLTTQAAIGQGDPQIGDYFDAYNQALPLLGELPYVGEGFRVVQRDVDHYEVQFFSRDETERRVAQERATIWLQSKGVDPNAVQIDYR